MKDRNEQKKLMAGKEGRRKGRQEARMAGGDGGTMGQGSAKSRQNLFDD